MNNFDELTQMIAENLENNTDDCKKKFSGVYVKDDKLHVIAVNNNGVGYYKNMLGSDNIEYHSTDVSYDTLIETRNILHGHFDEFKIAGAGVIDEKSVIEIELLDLSSAEQVVEYLKSKNVSDDFIKNHVTFAKGEYVKMDFPDYDSCVEAADNAAVNATTYTAYPGREIFGANTYSGSKSYASLGFCATCNSIKGIVTAFHFAVHVSKYYWSSPSGNDFFATRSGMVTDENHDAAFVPFYSVDGSTTNVSKVINGTSKTITNVASKSFLSTLTGKTVTCYGCVSSGATGTVENTSKTYNMSYRDSLGNSKTQEVQDVLRLTGTSIDHGDSGGPVIYESGSKIYLLGIVSGRSDDDAHKYQYINKISNINDALETTVIG